jgi:hypothetical protein
MPNLLEVLGICLMKAPEPLDLLDVDDPNLLEDIFDYDQIPRVTFEGKIYEEVDGKLYRI